MFKVKDIMITEVVTIAASALISEAIGLMRQKKIHSLIIKPRGSEKAYGILTETDIAYKVIAFGEDPKALKVSDIMTKPCIALNPEMTVEMPPGYLPTITSIALRSSKMSCSALSR